MPGDDQPFGWIYVREAEWLAHPRLPQFWEQGGGLAVFQGGQGVDFGRGQDHCGCVLLGVTATASAHEQVGQSFAGAGPEGRGLW